MDYSFIYEKGKNDTLICIFAVTHKTEYRNILSPFTCHKVFASDLNRMWFNKSTTFETIKTKLNNTIEYIQPKKIVFLGTSMGGFASIVYSKYCPCHTVIAFSPSITTEYHFYSMWPNVYQSYKKILTQMPNHRSALDCFQDNVTYYVYCARHNKVDRKHFDQIPDCPNIRKTLFDIDDHNLSGALRKSRKLLPILRTHIED
jgi:hypothetical protein